MNNQPMFCLRALLMVMFLTGIDAVTVAIADTTGAAFTREKQEAITHTEALELLKQGNERFFNGKTVKQNYSLQVQQTSTGQFPFATVVSCLDSRIPPAIVFDQGIGHLFVARIAGNYVNDDILGSLEFATRLSGSKLIVVMGHTDCGAIKGACDAAQLGLLTATLANINPAVNAVQGSYVPRNSKNSKFVQDVAEMNVQLTLKKLRDRSVVLREMIDNGEIGLVGAMYDVSSGKVTFYE